MFSVTITSKSAARVSRSIAAESTSWCSSATSGNSSRQHARDRLAPQARGLEHVGLVDRRDLATPRPREPPGDARDALDLSDRVAALVGREVGLAFLAPEIDPAGQFADDHEIDALQQLRLAAATRDAMPDAARPGADWRRGRAPCASRGSPARAAPSHPGSEQCGRADRAEQDGVRLARAPASPPAADPDPRPSPPRRPAPRRARSRGRSRRRRRRGSARPRRHLGTDAVAGSTAMRAFIAPRCS